MMTKCTRSTSCSSTCGEDETCPHTSGATTRVVGPIGRQAEAMFLGLRLIPRQLVCLLKLSRNFVVPKPAGSLTNVFLPRVDAALKKNRQNFGNCLSTTPVVVTSTLEHCHSFSDAML